MIFQRIIPKSIKFKSIFGRLLSTNNLANTYMVECLKNRGLIRISGNEVDEYLQGLITNDMKHLKAGSPCIYTMFLNSKGRVLYDSIIYNTKETNNYFVECDLSVLDLLKKHLLIYKVRRKITVDSLQDDYSVWVLNSASIQLDSKSNLDSSPMKGSLAECMIYDDPRISNLGLRIIAPKDTDVVELLKTVPNSNVSVENFYRSLRYKLGIGEGIDELPPGNCFALESNCDYLNGVSFNKGCYIGQELTARSYHTGVIRKRLMPLMFEEEVISRETDIPVLPAVGSDKPIGKLRGIDRNVGIGLLRVEDALKASELKVLDKLSRTNRPYWWPVQDQK
ncbi:UNVERIFIED_CONTAM: hypothetical protein PYX00_007003 [Menopon gallinae]|uniref:Transferase CAF17 homolog, mitochondrial n=1 Tax=Menopon gallinae TaxID=328185 RepID=A0AAW2HHC3_9NEOP